MGMETGDRVKSGRKAHRLSQIDLGKQADVSQQAISDIESGAYGSSETLSKLAKFFGVDLAYLTVGAKPWPPWAPEELSTHQTRDLKTTGNQQAGEPLAVIREEGANIEKPKDYKDEKRPDYAGPTGPMVFAGSVGAGPGVPTYFERPKSFKMRPTLAAFRVYGNSAYPVAYDGQFVVVDLKRKIHHNNLVVIQTKDNMAHFKRWCFAPGSPDGFVLASINSGINSPYIPESEIKNKWPVVGVMFEEEPADGDIEDGQ